MNFKEIRDSLLGDDINKGLQVCLYVYTERDGRVIYFSSLLLIQTTNVPKFIPTSPYDRQTRPWYTRIFLSYEWEGSTTINCLRPFLASSWAY